MIISALGVLPGRAVLFSVFLIKKTELLEQEVSHGSLPGNYHNDKDVA